MTTTRLKHYSDNETSFIEKNFYKMSKGEMAKKLNRPESAIRAKFYNDKRKIKLASNKPGKNSLIIDLHDKSLSDILNVLKVLDSNKIAYKTV